MAIRTEMISIAMPQPVEAKFPGIYFIPNPTDFLQWGRVGTGLCSLVQRDTLIVVTCVFTKGIEAFCQEWNVPEVVMGHTLVGPRGGIDQIKKEGVPLITKAGLPACGRREQRESRGLRGRGTHLAGLGWPSTQTLAPGWQTDPATLLRRRWATQPEPASSGRG